MKIDSSLIEYKEIEIHKEDCIYIIKKPTHPIREEDIVEFNDFIAKLVYNSMKRKNPREYSATN